MISVNISIVLVIISFIIAFFIGYKVGHKGTITLVDGYFLIDKSPNLENERWTWFFDTPLSEIDENRKYVVMRVEHKE